MADISPLIIENITPDTDTTDRKLRIIHDKVVFVNLANIHTVKINGSAGFHHGADKIALLVQNRTVRIYATDIPIGTIFYNTIVVRSSQKAAIVVEDLSGFDDFADKAALAVGHDTFGIYLVTGIVITFFYFSVFVQISDLFTAIADNRAATNHLGDYFVAVRLLHQAGRQDPSDNLPRLVFNRAVILNGSEQASLRRYRQKLQRNQ